jgi:hypothetical protein
MAKHVVRGARAIPTPAGGRIPPRPVGDKGGRRPSEPQSIERGSVLCDNGELRRWDGSAGTDMQRGVQRGNTLCSNPQRRHVRREGRILPRPVGDEGRRRPSEPQSIERGSVLCDNGELRVTDTGCNYKRINHLALAESTLRICRSGGPQVRQANPLGGSQGGRQSHLR